MSRTHNLILAAAGTTALLLAAACGGGKAAPPPAPPAPPAWAATTAPTPVVLQPKAAGESPTRVTAATADPGTLPQTHTLPTQDPQFAAHTRLLWQAIVRDDPSVAQPFFFPLSAYLQVKDISDPAQDYRDRLIAWYDLDIRAAHDLLGADAANAKLVSVEVPQDQAEWIEPGAEYNKGSYYRVYGTRLTYQENGHTASFGIFSLISWRGQWYVVHLGPSTREATAGIVYDPRT